ncbi:FAD-dependent oxidoreductase [Arsenicitalea aurantiaca]|uniref:FAD-dependent oxidoreductase n=1 Tax=Arsenicitalea aurantiaca TaxID=1783274 RepID=A0A433X844_9HYPH|nr:FAD-dependent oxidoreductase [Arsenicitalea aurantiaca]RUT30234.1 FAD-dependent oxidoreductase [Arsenicitalea aurantiaca]
MNSIDYRAELPELAECDVLVVGGGSAGSAAAIAAARQGARVVLVERYGFLGGTGVMVLDTFYGFYTPGAVERKVVGGIPDEVIAGLEKRKMVLKRPNTYGAGAGLTYDPETLKVVWDELAAGAGVSVLFHAYFLDILKDGDRLAGIVVGTPKGPQAIRARIIVDSSGDAHVAARAGAPFEDAGALGIAQSLTTTFKMINVDVARAKAFPKAEMWALMAEKSDRYRLPRKEGSAHITPHEGVMVTNMTRVGGVDGTEIVQLSAAEREGRAQALEYARFLKAEVPGYENAVLGGLATQIGVRETRRIKGRYWLTREDVLSAAKFDDAIAQCGAPIEEHHAGGDTRWEYVPDSGTYDIPYRALLPQQVDGLIVAGRCLSASHDAHASVRSIGQCLAMGQAAGVAAALSVANGAEPSQIDPKTLRTRLLEMGAILS